MASLYDKLQRKAHARLLILDLPDALEAALAAPDGAATAQTLRKGDTFDFALGYEPVRQVALDDDWSALRFRRVEYIGAMARHPDGTLTAAGRAKASAGRATKR